jgi:hypothetical protein
MSKTSEALARYEEEGIPIPECVNINCDRDATVRDVKASGNISFHNMCSRCKRQHEAGEPLDDGITNIRENVCDNSDEHLGWTCPVADEELESYQFILDHIDGDHNNNDPDNLHTLCRYCDAEKSKQAGDWGN